MNNNELNNELNNDFIIKKQELKGIVRFIVFYLDYRCFIAMMISYKS